jgi:PAS domain S-box-containing protein
MDTIGMNNDNFSGRRLVQTFYDKAASIGLVPMKVLAVAVVVTMLLFALFCFQVWDAYRDFRTTQTVYFKLQELKSTIVHFDEVLTMSARMGAATGNLRWEKRYRTFEPRLDAAIKETMKLAPETFVDEAAANTDAANSKLVAMENRAFDLIREEQREAAMTLLSGEEYETQKRIYSEGMEQINAAIQERLKSGLRVQRRRSSFTVIFAFTVLPILLFAWLRVLRMLGRHGAEQRREEKSLKRDRDELEKSIEERTANLNVANEQLKQEIAERRQAEEELLKTKEHLDNIIESSVDCIVVTDSKGNITRVNKSFMELIDYVEEEILGKHTTQFSPFDEGTYESVTGELVEIKKKFFDDARDMASRLREEGKVSNWERCFMRKDRKLVPVEVNMFFLYNEKREVTGAVGIIRDITERRRAKEEKARIDASLENKVTELSIMNEIGEVLLSTRKLDEILHMILIGATAYQALGFNRAFLFLVNGEGNVLEGEVATGSLNREEAYRIWDSLSHENLSLKELVKSRYGQLSREDEPINNLVKQMKIPLQGTDSIFSQAVYEKKYFGIVNGRENPLIDKDFINLLGTDSFALVPLVSRGKSLGVLLADNFINQKPIGDEDVVHLRAFAHHASLAIENAHLYKSLEEKIDELNYAYNELQENRDKLIRYERLSAVGEVAAKLTHEIRNPLVSIGGFARRILKKDHDEELNRKYVKIIVEEIGRLENILTDVLYFAKPAVPRCETVDLNRIIKNALEVMGMEIEKNNVTLEQRLDYNLPVLWLDENQIRRVLINLIRNATQAMPDGGAITVSTVYDDQWVRVDIADTGVGVSEEDADKLFDAFFTSKSTGSGLGLTVSAQIVSNQGGTIEVQKRIPKGTIFTINLPVKASS